MSCVIVLGCYRSGTSAVAGVLHHLGIMMGTRFDLPGSNNPEGFWEDLDLKEAKDDSQLKAFIADREGKYSNWGVKDPALCSNLSKFVSYLQPETDHRLIVCRRAITDIAISMAKASAVSNLSYNKLARFYVDAMNKELESYSNPILEVHYVDLLRDSETEINRIAEFVSKPVTQAALEHIKMKNSKC